MNPSVCFPHIPTETTENQVAQLFEGVLRVDLVTMEDSKGEFKMAFVHFLEPEKYRAFVNFIAENEFYMNDWIVKPNYKPVQRSMRKWSPEDQILIDQYFQEMEKKDM